MIPKQDRIKPRTVEDLERRYKFKTMENAIDELVGTIDELVGKADKPVLVPSYKIVSDGAFIVFDLLQFKYGSDTYALKLNTEWVEEGSELVLVFRGLSIQKL